jgi:hypothetical protein
LVYQGVQVWLAVWLIVARFYSISGFVQAATLACIADYAADLWVLFKGGECRCRLTEVTMHVCSRVLVMPAAAEDA